MNKPVADLKIRKQILNLLSKTEKMSYLFSSDLHAYWAEVDRSNREPVPHALPFIQTIWDVNGFYPDFYKPVPSDKQIATIEMLAPNYLVQNIQQNLEQVANLFKQLPFWKHHQIELKIFNLGKVSLIGLILTNVEWPVIICLGSSLIAQNINVYCTPVTYNKLCDCICYLNLDHAVDLYLDKVIDISNKQDKNKLRKALSQIFNRTLVWLSNDMVEDNAFKASQILNEYSLSTPGADPIILTLDNTLSIIREADGLAVVYNKLDEVINSVAHKVSESDYTFEQQVVNYLANQL